jgi:hypothetical protein
LVSRALSYSFRRDDSVVAAQIEAMQCVDTAFAHAAFDGHRNESLRHKQLLVSSDARMWLNDAAIVTA